MVWSLILVYLESSVANFSEKTLTKSAYLLETSIEISSLFKWAIWTLHKRYTLSFTLELILKITTYIMKSLWSGSKTTVTNSFFFIS